MYLSAALSLFLSVPTMAPSLTKMKMLAFFTTTATSPRMLGLGLWFPSRRHFSYGERKAASKSIEAYLTWKLLLEKYGLKPEHPFEEDYASCQIAILPENFFSEADKGNIVIKRSLSKWCFWEGGVEFDDGSRLEADVVVLATGFDGKKKLKAIIPDPFRSLLEFPSGMMPLYRGTINPLIPNLAFVGYIESVSNLHTAEIRCKWLSRLVDEQFKLRSVEKMLDQTSKEMEIMKRTATRFYRRSCISTFSINQVMRLVKRWSGVHGGRIIGFLKSLALTAAKIMKTKK